MPAMRRLLRALVVVAVAGVVACSGEPPRKEMQQAQSAIDAAKAAGADEYARDELAGSVGALKQAYDAVEERDYRLALGHAMDSRERAQTAMKQATDEKATERERADRAMTALAAAIGDATARLKSAESAHASPRVLAASRKANANAQKRVQEARAAYETGDYRAAAAIASSAREELGAQARGSGARAAASAHRDR
jgi:hypothetical protein